MKKNQLDQWVMEAISLLPDRFLKRMQNLVFVVDDRPTRSQLKECALRRGYALLGLYQGYEQIERRPFKSTPDQVSIFRNAILEKYCYPKRIKEQIYKTVWHEVAHHFGASERQAEQAEERMFNKYIKIGKRKSVQKREVKLSPRVKPGRRGYKRRSKVTFRVKK